MLNFSEFFLWLALKKEILNFDCALSTYEEVIKCLIFFGKLRDVLWKLGEVLVRYGSLTGAHVLDKVYSLNQQIFWLESCRKDHGFKNAGAYVVVGVSY